jgi:hypothetical protein
VNTDLIEAISPEANTAQDLCRSRPGPPISPRDHQKRRTVLRLRELMAHQNNVAWPNNRAPSLIQQTHSAVSPAVSGTIRP